MTQEERLEEMRNTPAPKKASEKKDIRGTNLYHESFLMRILGLLGFYGSLAKNSPAALALIKSIANPDRLNLLI
jgi:hypothetical protein